MNKALRKQIQKYLFHTKRRQQENRKGELHWLVDSKYISHVFIIIIIMKYQFSSILQIVE